MTNKNNISGFGARIKCLKHSRLTNNMIDFVSVSNEATFFFYFSNKTSSDFKSSTLFEFS